MYELQMGNELQRWIALTDAYAQQIEQQRIRQSVSRTQLSVMARGLQKVSNAFAQAQGRRH